MLTVPRGGAGGGGGRGLGGGRYSHFVCYIGSFLAYPPNKKNKNKKQKKKKKKKKKKYVSISQYPQTYQDYTLQPMLLTKISHETV